MRLIILENIRSAYNVGNILRTADALGRGVILSGYTPSPLEEQKVAKTSLGSEHAVFLKQFWNTKDTYSYLKEMGCFCIALECISGALYLDKIGVGLLDNVALFVGNEVEGILQETLEICDMIVQIPMIGIKESLNVGQAAAIGMWEINKKCGKQIS